MPVTPRRKTKYCLNFVALFGELTTLALQAPHTDVWGWCA